MFVRIKNRPNGSKSVQIVENIRRGNKVIQKVVRHYGQATKENEIEARKNLAEKEIIGILNDRNPVLPIFKPEDFYSIKTRKTPLSEDTKINIKQIKETKRVKNGIEDIFGDLYKKLGFDTLIQGTKKDIHWNDVLKQCVLARVANPVSKRASVKELSKDFCVELDLDQVYRMMDHVSEQEKEIKKHISQLEMKFFKPLVDVVFFDITTLYFESFEADELMNFGFSKDCKFNQTQIVLALMTNSEGIPITYELFPGNMYEGNTLVTMIQLLKSDYQINNIVLVADRAMFTEANLSIMDQEKIKYVVAAKLKTLPKEVKKEILADQDYKAGIVQDELHWSKTVKHNGRNIIVSYSQKRAKKDKADRDRLIERLLKKCKNKDKTKVKVSDLVNNRGSKKYITVIKDEAIINQIKIDEDVHWDGLHGVVTNIEDQSINSVLERYRGLWKIEAAFRINKNDLKMRPIFHWKSSRIRAHIAMCFLAYSLVSYAQDKLKKSDLKISFAQMRDELLRCQCSILKDIKTQAHYGVPSKFTQEQKNIYEVFGINRSDTPFLLATS